MAQIPTFDIENSIPGRIAGIDEAGRGPLAGPVVAAAVVLDPATMPEGLRDSKTLTEKRRETLADALMECAAVGVGVAEVEEIDRINILQATLAAMARAEAALPFRPDACLVDGNSRPPLRAPAHLVVKGDAKSFSIAAASIVAKVARDRIMRELAKDFPEYAWEKNKGYGAKAHLEALALNGPTPHHRRSFKPVSALVASGNAQSNAA